MKQVLLNLAAERGWGQVPKLSQCALTEIFSGNTPASEKCCLEMHLSSRVGYLKYKGWIVSDLRFLPADWTIFCNAWQDCEVLRIGMWMHQASGAGLQIQFLFLGGRQPNCSWRTWGEEAGQRETTKGNFHLLFYCLKRLKGLNFIPIWNGKLFLNLHIFLEWE